MVGDKLAGNQKDQHRLQRNIAKKKIKRVNMKICFLKSVRIGRQRRDFMAL